MEDAAKNNDTLGDLYALRAGLSVISQSADELAQTEENVNKIKSDAIRNRRWKFGLGEYNYSVINGEEIGRWASFDREKFKTLKELQKQTKWAPCKFDVDYDCEISDLDDEYEDHDDPEYLAKVSKLQEKKDVQYKKGEEVFFEWLKTSESEEYLNNKKKEQSESCETRTNSSKRLNIVVAVTLIILSLTIILAVVGILKSIMPLAIVGIVIAVICLLSLYKPLRVLSARKHCGKSDKNELEEYEESLNNVIECREIFAQCDEENQPAISCLKQNFNAIYKSLQKTFNKLLDERDWQYLDLIIFYIETGRAESIKEALQLLEREIQTKRIIRAIHEATECICSTIESAAARISAQLGVISNQLSQVVSLQQKQIAQNAEIISQAKLQNALIAKSNVTSEQLMNDVKYIKTYGVEIR